MDEEKFLSGYCRCMDCSRTVTAELVDGKLDNVDCGYGSCVYQGSCPIAAEIEKIS
jgi:hypothetical protein